MLILLHLPTSLALVPLVSDMLTCCGSQALSTKRCTPPQAVRAGNMACPRCCSYPQPAKAEVNTVDSMQTHHRRQAAPHGCTGTSHDAKNKTSQDYPTPPGVLGSMCHHPPQYSECAACHRCIHQAFLPPRTDHQAGLTGLQCNAELCGCHHFPRHWQICHPCIQYCTTHAAQPDAKHACHYCVTTCLFVTVRATMVCYGAATGHDRARDPHCAPCAAEETRLNRSSRQCQIARN
jgi:hypothetical protein